MSSEIVIDKKDEETDFSNGYKVCNQEIVDIANDLIREYHTDAAFANIHYIFKEEHQKSGNKVVLGKCTKQSDKLKFLHGFDFIIEFAHDIWQELNDVQKKALILHELKHISIGEDADGNIKLKTSKHDLEEFRDVVEVFGLYTQDLSAFAETILEAKEKE